jgi:hypothetical protein
MSAAFSQHCADFDLDADSEAAGSVQASCTIHIYVFSMG